MSVDAQELERIIRVQVELESVRRDFSILSDRFGTLSNHVDSQINTLSEKIDTRVSALDAKIDSKFNWIIRILGIGIISIILELGWIIINDKHVSFQDNTPPANHR